MKKEEKIQKSESEEEESKKNEDSSEEEVDELDDIWQLIFLISFSFFLFLLFLVVEEAYQIFSFDFESIESFKCSFCISFFKVHNKRLSSCFYSVSFSYLSYCSESAKNAVEFFVGDFEG